MIFEILVLPALLGLLGFVEPCSIGSSILFVRYVQHRPAAEQRWAALLFLAVRAFVLGVLGASAAILGAAFESLWPAGWLLLGSLYLLIGVLYLTGRAGYLFHQFGLRLSGLSASRGALSLGLLFGMNIPACAAPLIAALLGQSAFGIESGAARGFATMAVFGSALSAPLIVAVRWTTVRHQLARVSAWSNRVPAVLGLVLIVLGIWSIYQGIAFDGV